MTDAAVLPDVFQRLNGPPTIPDKISPEGSLLMPSHALAGASELLKERIFSTVLNEPPTFHFFDGKLSRALSSSQIQVVPSFSEAFIDQTIRRQYVLRNKAAIAQFLSAHRAATSFLSKAVPELRTYFGNDAVLALEALVEDNEAASLYAIVVWKGDPQKAEIALAAFDEHWLLDQIPLPGVTFTYELA